MLKEELVVGLVAGRHEMPVSEYIFDEIKDVLDFSAMRSTISKFIVERVGVETSYGSGINQNDYTAVNCFHGKRDLVVYVTGLTAAVAELISMCALNGINLTLMHYDRESESYKAQTIF